MSKLLTLTLNLTYRFLKRCLYLLTGRKPCLTYSLPIRLRRHFQRWSVLDRLHPRTNRVHGFYNAGQILRVIRRPVLPPRLRQCFHTAPEHRYFSTQIIKRALRRTFL
ncbi:hypothetical protein SXCC_00232 [Gluconacetobacter sp. SXCC-1]|nr:hypothetical protein SXCC_00232 [Gluconacetobacter sp. SXCC-1]